MAGCPPNPPRERPDNEYARPPQYDRLTGPRAAAKLVRAVPPSIGEAPELPEAPCRLEG